MNIIREDSQIDFTMGNVFCSFGEWRWVYTRFDFSKFVTINFSGGEIAGLETLSVRKNFIGNINLDQTSCLNLLDKFGIGNDISDFTHCLH